MQRIDVPLNLSSVLPCAMYPADTVVMREEELQAAIGGDPRLHVGQVLLFDVLFPEPPFAIPVEVIPVRAVQFALSASAARTPAAHPLATERAREGNDFLR